MKILVYDDSSDFGGHQAMALRGIEGLHRDPAHEVIAAVNPLNRRLVEKLSLMKDVSVEQLSHVRPSRLPIRNDHTVDALFSRLRPDIVLCIQGDTEQSAAGLLAARKNALPCISYLALPHSKAVMGARFGMLRDRLNRSLLNLPDRYITLSPDMKQQLLDRGAQVPVEVIPNGIPIPHAVPKRANPPIPVLGMLGRIEFRQKHHDFMVQVLSRLPASYRLVIKGDGPDRPYLEKLVAQSSCAERIELLPWSDDTDGFFHRIGCLVIPSRYEGVPLVMLEALARGIPVLANNRDGMKDLLPSSWLFEMDRGLFFADMLTRAYDSGFPEIPALAERVRKEMTVERFREAFRIAVTGG